MNTLWYVERLKGSGQWARISSHTSFPEASLAFEAASPPDTLAVRIVRDGGFGCCSGPEVERERSILRSTP